MLIESIYHFDKRITPEEITKLKEKEIFVFGSNEGGYHSKGAAKQAMTWGAIWRQAAGLQGKTYGIPTKDKSIRRILTIDEIKKYVDDYIQFAKRNPEYIFLTTAIGCGLAKYKPKDIAPLFEEAIPVENIYLPEKFWKILKNRCFPYNTKPMVGEEYEILKKTASRLMSDKPTTLKKDK
jgi:hypothetical protein